MRTMLLNELIRYPSILPQAWPCLHYGPKGALASLDGPGARPALLVIHLVIQQTFIYQVPAASH